MQKSILSRVVFLFLDNMVWLLVLVSLVAFSILSDKFLTPITLLNIIPRVAAIGILVIGQSFTMLTGHFDLSSESNLGVTAMIAALLIATPDLGGWGTMLPAWQAIIVMLVIGTLVGVVNGLLITKLRINNLVLTIAMMILLRGIPYIISPSTSASNLGGFFDWLGGGSLFIVHSGKQNVGVQVSMIFMLIAFAVAVIVTRYTQFGRNMYAVGANRDAAEASGIRSDRVILAVYIISGFCAALAGLVAAGRSDSATMTIGTGWIFPIQAAAIIGGISLSGGRGNMVGALGGVLLWGILDTGLFIMRASPWTIDAFRGGLLLLAMLLQAIKVRYMERRALQEQLSKTTIGLTDASLGF